MKKPNFHCPFDSCSRLYPPRQSKGWSPCESILSWGKKTLPGGSPEWSHRCFWHISAVYCTEKCIWARFPGMLLKQYNKLPSKFNCTVLFQIISQPLYLLKMSFHESPPQSVLTINMTRFPWLRIWAGDGNGCLSKSISRSIGVNMRSFGNSTKIVSISNPSLPCGESQYHKLVVNQINRQGVNAFNQNVKHPP